MTPGSSRPSAGGVISARPSRIQKFAHAASNTEPSASISSGTAVLPGAGASRARSRHLWAP